MTHNVNRGNKSNFVYHYLALEIGDDHIKVF